jgi:hypothetical protein
MNKQEISYLNNQPPFFIYKMKVGTNLWWKLILKNCKKKIRKFLLKSPPFIFCYQINVTNNTYNKYFESLKNEKKMKKFLLKSLPINFLFTESLWKIIYNKKNLIKLSKINK